VGFHRFRVFVGDWMMLILMRWQIAWAKLKKNWLLVVGCWLLVDGCWLMVDVPLKKI
jgi:hypothetical protein